MREIAKRHAKDKTRNVDNQFICLLIYLFALFVHLYIKQE